MANTLEVDTSRKRSKGPGDQYSDSIDEKSTAVAVQGHKLDSEESRRELSKLLEWFYFEKERQSGNRLEMATDHDFYDSIQWDPEDAAEVEGRGQMPLVYNEVAPMVDWLIGTERRARVDWKVFPRNEKDVKIADTKTKVMKYVSDQNRVPFLRSRAFADAVKGGVGWMDDGVRDDPTQDVLYSRYEDWRNILWDSTSYEHDLSDARYIFRWRWVDEDIAIMMFPDRADKIRAATEDSAYGMVDGDDDDVGPSSSRDGERDRIGALYASGSGMMVDAKRRRVKLIECQYRKPVSTKIVGSGALKGAIFDTRDQVMAHSLAQSGATIIDKVMMRMHVAVFTPAFMLASGPSMFRHNKFTLTPIWCYRRSRDRQPYGVIRRVRDVQQDLNKRASKALFLLNTNQLIAEEGATDDWETLRDEAGRPDGLLIIKAGKKVELRRDTDAATGQIQMMTLDAQSIQKSAGVAQENMGRQTNAVSGEAIKARQMQGSVVTTEPFDNLRFATQAQGEKQLSLTEQFYTEEKVVRLTGSKDAIEWVQINVPEVQPDGSVRFLNDITASQSDFVVAEQDYSGTLRQVMFDALNQMAAKLPPEIALRLMNIAMEFSDLPNKDEVAEAIRKLTGDRDPNKPMSPEEEQAAQAQQQEQIQAMEYQREQAMATLDEQRARVREINAKAAKLEAEAQAAGAGGMDPAVEGEINSIRSQASDQLESMSQELAKAQSELASRTMAINKKADTDMEIARIKQDTDLRVAEINASSDKRISALEARIESLTAGTPSKKE